MQKSFRKVPTYNIGEVWQVLFPYQEKDDEKLRPAIVIDDDTIAILTVMVTSKNKDVPYSIELEDWDSAGLTKPSWTRIDRIVKISEWNIDSKIGELSDRDLAKILQLTKEYLSGSFHEFSLLAIKNSNDEFLQIFDDRWQCWLFPYVETTDDNKANVDAYVSNLLKSEYSTRYVAVAKHCKFSESDKVYKIYNHKLYTLELEEIPESLKNDRIKWMSFVSA
jgi:mRNA-degrading endonuclease toxin of MazEF toxin-antitoxin module